MIRTRTISRKFRSVLRMVRSHGLRDSLQFVFYRFCEEFHERRLGVRTTGFVSKEELGYQIPEFGDYVPCPYQALRYCLARVPIRAGEDVLLDYGCGMGRAIILAATKPFRRVIGVEISPEMAAEAQLNLRRARKRLRCKVDIQVADARFYSVPDDVTVVHLFNPFNGDTLAQVISNILESQRRSPRALTIIFGNPNRFEEMFGGQDWLNRQIFRSFYPGTGYGIYRISKRECMQKVMKPFYPKARVFYSPFGLLYFIVWMQEKLLAALKLSCS